MSSLLNDCHKLNRAAPIPKGWRTGRQIAEDDGISYSRTRELLRIAIKAGIWESMEWKIPDSLGTPRLKPIYRRKPGAK